MFGEFAPYDANTYTFISDYLPWASGDGMEHRNSTAVSEPGLTLRTPAGRTQALDTISPPPALTHRRDVRPAVHGVLLMCAEAIVALLRWMPAAALALVACTLVWMIQVIAGFRTPWSSIVVSDGDSGGAVRQLVFASGGLLGTVWL